MCLEMSRFKIAQNFLGSMIAESAFLKRLDIGQVLSLRGYGPRRRVRSVAHELYHLNLISKLT